MEELEQELEKFRKDRPEPKSQEAADRITKIVSLIPAWQQEMIKHASSMTEEEYLAYEKMHYALFAITVFGGGFKGAFETGSWHWGKLVQYPILYPSET